MKAGRIDTPANKATCWLCNVTITTPDAEAALAKHLCWDHRLSWLTKDEIGNEHILGYPVDLSPAQPKHPALTRTLAGRWGAELVGLLDAGLSVAEVAKRFRLFVPAVRLAAAQVAARRQRNGHPA